MVPGEPLATESIEAVRELVGGLPRRRVPVLDIGNGRDHAGDSSMMKITITSVAVMILMLLLVYRSIITVIVLVGVELLAARGAVAVIRA